MPDERSVNVKVSEQSPYRLALSHAIEGRIRCSLGSLTQYNLWCAVMSRTDDRRMMFVLKGCAPEID